MPINSDSIPWRAQPAKDGSLGPQQDAINKHWVEELFFGGALGGGKSDFLLGDFGQDVPKWGKAWQGILFRKHYGDLEFLIARSKEIYPRWFPGLTVENNWHPGDKEWRWPNGAVLRMRQLDHINDYEKYQGPEYTWIGWDELPQWESDKAYLMMKARLRSPAGVTNKRIRSTGNPGGRGHHWVKHYFGIDKHPMGGVVFVADASKSRRLFIRSRLEDNIILMQNDPNYIHNLEGLGSAELVKAWKDGDWNVVAGAFFGEFTTRRHVIRPFVIPNHWTKIRAMDWGSASPFAVEWLAVADGSAVMLDGEETYLPRGALVVYREYYGMSKPNVGLKMTADAVAREIAKREDETIHTAVLDPSAFKRDGGPSIAETMAEHKVYFTKGDNTRRAGWDQVRDRLKGDQDGKAMLYIFETCQQLIRTLPSLQHDPHKPEDCDTDTEDHAPDALRYGCMARPWVRTLPETERERVNKSIDNFVEHKPTFNELLEGQRRRRIAQSD